MRKFLFLDVGFIIVLLGLSFPSTVDQASGSSNIEWTSAGFAYDYTHLQSGGRHALAATSIGGKALFAGGERAQCCDFQTYSDQVDIYDMATDTWSVARLSQARGSLTATSVGSKAIFAGGTYYGYRLGPIPSTYPGVYSSNVVDIYDSATNTWSTSHLAVGRTELASATLGDRAYFAGGYNNSDLIDVYDDSTNTWGTLTLPRVANRLAMTAACGKVFFAGGYSPLTDRVDIYDVETGVWSTATLSEPRSLLVATTVADKAIFAGGLGSAGATSAVDIYDCLTDTWSTSALSQSRYYLAATTFGDLAFFAGGYVSAHQYPYYSSAVDIYDASTDTWINAALSRRRMQLAATSVGDRAFFGGGSGLNPRCCSGGYFLDIVDIARVIPNLAPTVDAGGPYTVMEGGTVEITATGSDPEYGALSYQLDLDGDGSFELIGPSGTFNATNLDGPGDYTVVARVTDSGGLSAVDQATISILNVAPDAVFEVPTSIDEGGVAQLSLTEPSDPSQVDMAAGFTFSFDCGDGSGYSPYSSVSDTSCPSDDDGTRIARAKIQDKDGGATEYVSVFEFRNVPPIAHFSNVSGPINEGQNASVIFTDPYDPSPVDSNAGFTYSYDCENGGTFEVNDTAEASYSCHFLDNGSFAIHGRIKDKDGSFSDYIANATVNNVAPIVGPITAPVEPVLVNTEIQASAEFSDAGLMDTHAAEWNWGDGTVTIGTVSEANGSGSTYGTYTYTTPGVYTVKLTIADNDGDSSESTYRFIVVYDPDGGFVTGGGWIDSPRGAYAADPDLSGKAIFGFVSKYRQGANIPTGNTEFAFGVGNLNFHSDAYDWLVVNQGSTNAQFKGSGRINGEVAPNGEDYRFMIWAKDNDPSYGDTFRIIIWYEDASGNEIEIYDNGFDQTVGGGSIQIHR